MNVGRTTRRRLIGAGGVALARAMAQPTRMAAGLSTTAISAPAELSGRVIWPRDPDYGEARLDFNARLSRFPAAIVICGDTRDVQNAIRWARQEGRPLRARSGGHSYDQLANHRTNRIMRLLTAISTIMLPLAVISGIYGMNIRGLPMADSEWALEITLGLMLAVAVGLLVLFRRRRWL